MGPGGLAGLRPPGLQSFSRWPGNHGPFAERQPPRDPRLSEHHGCYPAGARRMAGGATARTRAGGASVRPKGWGCVALLCSVFVSCPVAQWRPFFNFFLGRVPL